MLTMRACLAFSFALVFFTAPVEADSPPALGAAVERNVWMPLSDGVRLSTDLYLPAHGKPAPVLLIRTPYGKAGGAKQGRYFASHGYALVVQDCRGSGESEGHFYPYSAEGKDGNEAQTWAGTQEWSTGVVGTLGASYLGGTQWLATPYKNRHLKTMVPSATFSNFYNNLYLGGAYRVNLAGRWTSGRSGPKDVDRSKLDFTKAFLHLPLIEMDEVFGWRIPMLRDWTGNDRSGDAYWKPFNVESTIPELEIPALHVVGLYDFFVADTVKSYLMMSRLAKTDDARRAQKLILGPWDHGTIGKRQVAEVDFGPHAVLDRNALYKRWFDRYLKGIDNGLDSEAPIRYFVMGLNQWREAFRWPPQATRRIDYFLSSEGHANTAQGDGALATGAPLKAGFDTFVADPDHPVPAKGGRDVEPSYTGAWGPFDQSGIERHPQVLVYTTPPLQENIEVAGPLTATLYVESDAVDTDVVVKLVDVSPDGFAHNVATGILRGRFRDSLSSPTPLTPGQIYEWNVDMTHTSNRFLKGHRLRVDVAGSSFPLYDRNPNTGGGVRARTARTATQRLHHSPVYPSRITLPVSTAH
jgi:putative CocE/NonD family hydrolase